MQEIRSLTAIRGIAALWIVLHHFWPQTSSVTPHIIAKGYLAVDLFFILSGMVLFLVYEPALRSGRFNLAQFAIKRFARLYPLHLVTMCIAILILSLGPALGFHGRELPYDLTKMILLHTSLLHAWGLTETGGLNYPSWSLSAEAFAYLLFPALALLILRLRHTILLSLATLIICVLAAQLWWPVHLRTPTDVLVFTRFENDFGVLRILPEFLLGIAIAKSLPKIANSRFWLWIGAVQIAVGITMDADLLSITGFAALLAGFAALNPRAPEKLHSLGVLSYAIYMCHALVQIVGFKLIETFFGFPDAAVPVAFLLPMLAITIACAYALHHWIERPAQRWIVSLAAIKSAPPKAAHFAPK